jgi:hypothetical protein
MTAEPPQSPITEAVRSLEVRWIFPASWRPPWPDGSGGSRQRWSPARTPSPFLALRHTVEGPQTSSDLARPAGFEPATRCLEGLFAQRVSLPVRR